MKNLKVSYSALQTLQECSEKYKLKYIDRYRSTKQPSALWFGLCIDEAIEILLLTKKVELSEKELTLVLNEDYLDKFRKQMEEFKANHLLDMTFFNSDFDPLVFTLEDLSFLKTNYPDVDDFLQFIETEKTNKEKTNLELFNTMHWLSLLRKGEMLLTTYKEHILPEIHEVFHIQKDIELANPTGDILVGKIDFIASFKDDPTKVYICDNKTSSQAYKEDSVRLSEQLSIYTEALQTNLGAYVVLEKKIRIKDPKVRFSIIKDSIPDSTYEKVFTNIEKYTNMISEGNFTKKQNPKDCWSFGKICDYYDLCWKGITTNLFKREETK